MKTLRFIFALMAAFTLTTQAATINWSATVNNGFSLADGTNLATGSLVRLGYFRDTGTGNQLTDAQIQALAGSPATLNNSFVEVGTTLIGAGFSPSITAHWSASTTADTSFAGLDVAGKQMYLWVLNAATVDAATQHAILYWDITETATNPDSAPVAPGTRWSFPDQAPVPGNTTIDLTDLTIGASTLATGAHVVVGTFPSGTSSTTSSPNFGLAETVTPLQITTASPLAGSILGGSYSKTLTAIGGTGPYTWSLTGGNLPAGLTLSTDGVVGGASGESGSFFFLAQVADSASSTVTRTFTLTVAASAVSITTSSLAEGTAGSAYSQQITATGGFTSYSFGVISGALPAGLSVSSAGLLSGTPTASGNFNFTVQVTDGINMTASQAFSLLINVNPISITTMGINHAVVSTPFSQAFTVSGGTAPYTWVITTGAVPGITLSSAGVLSGTPTTTGLFMFSVKVTDAVGLTKISDFGITVLAKAPVPVMQQPVFPVTMVSDSTFKYTLTARNYPKSFSATGLPAGLKLDAASGVISGRPTVSGVFVIQAKATNATGTSAAVSSKITVRSLPKNVVGSYIGVIERDSSVNGNLGGRIDLTTTTTGSFTVKLTLGSKTVSYTNVIQASGANPTITASTGIYQLALTLNATTNLLDGTVSVSGNSANVSAWRRVWDKIANPADEAAGYYTAGLDISNDMGYTVPDGTGYASFTVALDGGLTIVGKTATGDAISCAGFMGPKGELLVHQVLYSNLGSLVGHLTLTADIENLYSESEISGSLTWLKPADTKTRTYAAGFGPVTVTAYGKYMASAATGSTVLGLPEYNIAMDLYFANGGADASATNPEIYAFTYSDANKVVLPTKGSDGYPSGTTTLSINAANGVVGGTFKLVDTSPALIRSVTFQGMIIRTSDAAAKAFGYFLLPQKPTGDQTNSTSPILSGQVVIAVSEPE